MQALLNIKLIVETAELFCKKCLRPAMVKTCSFRCAVCSGLWIVLLNTSEVVDRHSVLLTLTKCFFKSNQLLVNSFSICLKDDSVLNLFSINFVFRSATLGNLATRA